MTDYFEVVGRDGAARLGELRLADPVTTPTTCDEFLENAGSLWPTEREPPAGRDDRLTVVPHRGFPAGTDERVQAAFDVEPAAIDGPSAAVVTPETAADRGADAYVLSTAQGICGHARAFCEAIVAVREAIPPDTALYLPGVASPRNVALLIYAGVDLVDTDRAAIAGTQGRYLTVDGAYRLDDLEELPCPCPACDVPLDTFGREACADHNRHALAAALATARERLRSGRLRDYLEGQARHDGWLTATLRRLDDQWSYLETRTPIARGVTMTAATEDTLHRVEVRRFAGRITDRYRRRFAAPLALVPCSAGKPYGDSKSHRRFREAIDYRAHKVSLTSPLGVVPQELELTYPAQHYDAVVTGRWSEGEIAFVADVLERFLRRSEPPRIVAHVPPGGYRRIVERATADLAVEVAFTVEGHPTDADALSALDAALDGEPRYPREERRWNTVAAIADYQFGEGAGERLFEGCTVRGRFPAHRLFDGEEQLAAVVPRYGLLALTLAGARRLRGADLPTPTVEIDGFVPQGSVLAPGVRSAADAIRVGDEVVVEGPDAFAVGRAAMCGPEMAQSTRGVAVDVRHVEEL